MPLCNLLQCHWDIRTQTLTTILQEKDTLLEFPFLKPPSGNSRAANKHSSDQHYSCELNRCSPFHSASESTKRSLSSPSHLNVCTRKRQEARCRRFCFVMPESSPCRQPLPFLDVTSIMIGEEKQWGFMCSRALTGKKKKNKKQVKAASLFTLIHQITEWSQQKSLQVSEQQCFNDRLEAVEPPEELMIQLLWQAKPGLPRRLCQLSHLVTSLRFACPYSSYHSLQRYLHGSIVICVQAALSHCRECLADQELGQRRFGVPHNCG